jgi:glycosyltransferase involved in cell wall biosynthesis
VTVRAVALLATYNEERFIAGCIEHLVGQGLQVYVIDNCSTDRTAEIAERYLNRGVIGIETFPRAGLFVLRDLLRRKEELAAALDADWFMHADADEIRVSSCSARTLAQAFAQADDMGYNAVNFQEFTFIPTRESPDHDHPRFRETMRWYYPFLPAFPHRLNAWKRQPEPVDLATDAGHRVIFPGRRMYPKSLVLRHYLFLSVEHAIRKYGQRRHDPVAVANGWHGWRERFTPEMIELPSQTELRTYVSDDLLDASEPRKRHYISDGPS